MKKFAVFFAILFAGFQSRSQNDLDAIRYSRLGVNGTSRYAAMGGAFGALGADLSCSAYNPGGLGLYRKGDVSFGGGLRFTRNDGTVYGKTTNIADANFVFNNFGLSIAWPVKNDEESRHVVAFTNMQHQNFNEQTRLSAYTNNSSIAKDMLNIAEEKKNVGALNSNYEYMGYYVYVLDTANNQFFSFVDTKRTVLQKRDIVTSGRMNELNFSYAYAYKDKYYIGASLGVPRITYTSTTTHSESDDKDSMKVTITSPSGAPITYSTTYIDELPVIYTDKLGFNSLTYQEYFSTTGSGFNLKLGGVARINEYLRVGLYYHTPTILNLSDKYYNKMSASFDKDPNAVEEITDPENGGYYDYKIITPSRIGINTAFILGKQVAIGLDYELVNYRQASLSSKNLSDFAGVNTVIKNKYSSASNVRVGAEFNLKPLMIRAGYNMQGSPFGDVFTGSFVRNTISVGIGFRTKSNIYYDFAWMKTYSNEDYYMFNTIPQKSEIKYRNSQLAATIGIKF